MCWPTVIVTGLCAATITSACGDAQDAESRTETGKARPTPAQKARDNLGTGELRGVRFAVPPIVTVERCTRERRKCFPFAYVIYARLNRKIPHPRSSVTEAQFVISGAMPIDPIGRLRKPRDCFEQGFYANAPGNTGTPSEVGSRVRITLRVYDRRGKTQGELPTTVRLRQAEPPRPANDYSPPEAREEVGC